MKWQGSTEKTRFLEWVNKATKEELQEYVVERLYPSTTTGKIKRVLVWVIVSVLYLSFFFALIGMTLLFMTLNMHNDYMEDTVARHNNIGESVCADLGGFIEYGYKKDVMYAQCSDKIVLLDGNPLP